MKNPAFISEKCLKAVFQNDKKLKLKNVLTTIRVLQFMREGAVMKSHKCG